MFFSRLTRQSTAAFSKQIDKIRAALDTSDAVVIGAGAGLSTAAGYTYSGERFKKLFGDFAARYGFTDMYSGGVDFQSQRNSLNGPRVSAASATRN